ncbi:hypothetical protein CPC08DRAFT_815883 [Agrocybe pediades]|nr:hypothetical protein CPC08DRAFT_815883 [Agrocybe pediades]
MSSSTRRAPVGLPSNPRNAPRLAGPVTTNPHAEPHRTSLAMSQQRPIDTRLRRDPRPVVRANDGSERVQHSIQRRDQHIGSRNPRLSGESTTTTSSSSSETSSTCSRGNHSRASSRTTVRSDQDQDEQYTEVNQGSRSKDVRVPIASSNENTDAGYVWNRVTEVANVLTQEVTRVWAAGLGGADADYEEDDSHLTRVMRAYHLSKARTPNELPDWLFSERERGLGQARFDSHSHNNGRQMSTSQQAQQKPRNRPGMDNNIGTGAFAENKYTLSIGTTRVAASGTDRLKQLRSLRKDTSTFGDQ